MEKVIDVNKSTAKLGIYPKFLIILTMVLLIPTILSVSPAIFESIDRLVADMGFAFTMTFVPYLTLIGALIIDILLILFFIIKCKISGRALGIGLAFIFAYAIYIYILFALFFTFRNM